MIEDHIYARLHSGSERLPSLRQLDRANLVIQIDSFSKVAFPGLRVGWIIAPSNVIERLRLVKQTTDLHTDQLAQAILAEFTAPRIAHSPHRENAQDLRKEIGYRRNRSCAFHAGRNSLDASHRRNGCVGGTRSRF